MQGGDAGGGQRLARRRFIAFELHAVEAVQPDLRGQPEISVRCLRKRGDLARRAILDPPCGVVELGQRAVDIECGRRLHQCKPQQHDEYDPPAMQTPHAFARPTGHPVTCLKFVGGHVPPLSPDHGESTGVLGHRLRHPASDTAPMPVGIPWVGAGARVTQRTTPRASR